MADAGGEAERVVDVVAGGADSRLDRLMHQATHTSVKVRLPLFPHISEILTIFHPTVKKIKQDLIDRARIKKSFARTLKKEGLSSERLGSAGNATALGTRTGGYGTKGAAETKDESGSEEDADLLESGSDEEEGDDFEEDTELAAHRRRIKGKGREEPYKAETVPKERATDDGYPNRSRGSGNDRPSTSSTRTTNAHPRGNPTAPSSRQTNPPADGPSLRDMKRQAYLGPPPSALTTPVHPSRTRKQIAKPKPVGETNAADPKAGQKSRQAGTGAGAGAGERRRDGRPNLNARIGVMLEQIQRGR